MHARLHMLAAGFALVAVAACSKKDNTQPIIEGTQPPAVGTSANDNAELDVADIQLGSAVGSDRNITMPKTEFAPKDTIYAAVKTEGGTAAGSTLTAVWTYEKDGNEARVDSTSLSITPTGPTATEFHISRPGGLPTGDYHVEVWANGKSAGTRDFKVK
ncbi:MAG TPA: hypothetical protein VFS74_06160 [Gemmatimonadales bacterium]|jgi:hypothetical protein|nr:hypothetical protein [Gemmatimonadales bacterium]HEU4761887.1 hypothetical protein [Gemmatimonadales bacterium]